MWATQPFSAIEPVNRFDHRRDLRLIEHPRRINHTTCWVVEL
jgi:hypothetical protein